MSVLDALFLGNTALEWMIAGGIAVAVAAILAIVRGILSHRVKPTSSARSFLLVVVRHTRYVFLALIGIGVGATYLNLSVLTSRVLGVVVTLVTLLQVALWGHGVTKFWVQRVIRQRTEDDVGSVTAIRTFGTIGLVALWLVILLAAIATLGINVTGLVAGLGIGGIAIALAVQNIVGDLFASVSIIVDKPFVVGDFIQVDDLLGSVQQIGLKSTRIGSLSGEQLIFGNGDLLKSRIHNYKRMNERRVVFTIHVDYGTAPELVEKVPPMLRAAVTAQSPVRLDRAHFKEYGESGLTYEIVYYVLDPDYNKYMDIQQAINYTLYRGFRESGIHMALPTRTVMLHLSPDDVKALAGDAGRASPAAKPDAGAVPDPGAKPDAGATPDAGAAPDAARQRSAAPHT